MPKLFIDSSEYFLCVSLNLFVVQPPRQKPLHKIYFDNFLYANRQIVAVLQNVTANIKKVLFSNRLQFSALWCSLFYVSECSVSY